MGCAEHFSARGYTVCKGRLGRLRGAFCKCYVSRKHFVRKYFKILQNISNTWNFRIALGLVILGTSEQLFRERMVRSVAHMSDPGYKHDCRLYILYISAPWQSILSCRWLQLGSLNFWLVLPTGPGHLLDIWHLVWTFWGVKRLSYEEVSGHFIAGASKAICCLRTCFSNMFMVLELWNFRFSFFLAGQEGVFQSVCIVSCWRMWRAALIQNVKIK